MRKFALLLLCFFTTVSLNLLSAQDNAGYKLPPKDIADML